MAAGFHTDDDAISAINVTPLVDVTLVLLIIFLITAPALYQSAIKVKLPSATTGEQARKSPLEFSITRDGHLSFGKENMEWSQLGARLALLGPAASGETALIDADENTAHGVVIRLMDALRRAGVTRFALSVASSDIPAH